MARLSPTKNVIRRLFSYSGNVCAFPGCVDQLIDDDGDFIGQICHIEAAEKGGERYNALTDDEQRRAYENLLLLCYKHHIKTDDVVRYPVDALKVMKADHEAKFKDAKYKLSIEAEEKLLTKIFSKLDEIHSSLLEHQSLTEQGNIVGKDTNDATKQILAILEAQVGLTRISLDETKIYSERLDYIKQFKIKGKSVTALEELIKFKDENWLKIDEELRYKVLANIANTLFELGRTLEAGNYLRQLESLNYKTTDSLAYLALGYAVAEDKDGFSKIFRDPLMDNCKNSNLWIAYLHLFKDSQTPEQLQRSIPSEVLETSEILFALGEIFVDAEKFETGFSMLERSLERISGGIAKQWQLKGIIAAKKLFHIASIEKVAFKSFSTDEREQLKLLIAELTESWNHISQTEIASSSWHIVMNRGVAYKALSDSVNAENDFETAWRLTQNFTSFRNLILQYFETNQYNKAKKLLDLPGAENFPTFKRLDFAALRARHYFLTGDPDKANEVFVSELNVSCGEDRRFLLDLIIVSYFEVEVYEKTLPFIQQLISEFPESPHGYLSMGTCLGRMERNEEAVQI